MSEGAMKREIISSGTPVGRAGMLSVQTHREPLAFALEERKMFDGAGAVTAIEAVEPAVIEAAVSAPETSSDGTGLPGDAGNDGAENAALLAATNAGRSEIVFIDTGVDDWQTLAAGVDPASEIIMIDPARDGVSQISDALAGRSGIDAVHVISHGGEGFVRLGDTTVSAENLAKYKTEISSWSAALAEGADILLYGCDVGAGGEGLGFVESISSLTGADVAASNDDTGHASLGGDWQLETAVGTIETATVVSLAAQSAFNQAVLATISTPDLIAADDSGVSNTDNVTNNTTPTFTGSGAAPGSTVTLRGNGAFFGDIGPQGNALVDGSGNWSITSNVLARDLYDFTVSDDGGSVTSAALSVRIDTSATHPRTADLVDASDTGVSNTDNITDDNTPTFTVMVGEPDFSTGSNESVAFFSSIDGFIGNGTDTGTTAGPFNIFSFTPATALSGGVHLISVIATDTAGNASNPQTGAPGSGPDAPLQITINGPTAAPSTPDLSAASDTGSSNTDNLTNLTTPTLTGTAPNNATVTVISSLDGTLGTTTANGAGVWSFTAGAALSDGIHNITATAQLAGIPVSAQSAALAVTIDTAVLPSSTPDLVAASDTGIVSNTDNITRDTTPTLTGTADANSTVTVNSSLDGALGTTTANGAGVWTFTPGAALNEGVHNFTTTVTDLAGNTSVASAALPVTIDTTVPANTVPDLDAASDTGASNTDNITSNTTPTFTGTTEPGATVVLSSSSAGLQGNTVADASGFWTFTAPTPLAAGTHRIFTRIFDLAFNATNFTHELTITIEPEVVSPPSVPDLGAASDSGSSNTDNITNNTMPTFSGTAPINSTVTLTSAASGVLGTTIADGDGNWTFTVPTDLADGVHQITATATLAGVISVASGALAVTIDTLAPPPPVVQTDIGAGKSATGDFFGTAEAGSTISLTRQDRGGDTELSAVTGDDGNWRIDGGATGKMGDVVLSTATDLAGNVSTQSDNFDRLGEGTGREGAQDQVITDFETTLATDYTEEVEGQEFEFGSRHLSGEERDKLFPVENKRSWLDSNSGTWLKGTDLRYYRARSLAIPPEHLGNRQPTLLSDFSQIMTDASEEKKEKITTTMLYLYNKFQSGQMKDNFDHLTIDLGDDTIFLLHKGNLLNVQEWIKERTDAKEQIAHYRPSERASFEAESVELFLETLDAGGF